VVLVFAVLVGFAFGAGDQYLGSVVTLGSWAAAASLLSAPWLVLPFAFGCTQRGARRAVLAGLLTTLAALAGYWAVLSSPLEGAHLSLRGLEGWLGSNTWIVVGGLVTGPLFGFLGQRWRTRRAWLSAALVAGALCLEPLAERVASRTWSDTVSLFEIAAGLVWATYFLVRGTAFRRRGQPGTGGAHAG
jgi:hypothetical protein